MLEKIYPGYLNSANVPMCMIDKLSAAFTGSRPAQRMLLERVVGLDWVGDELGVPYCAFAHYKVTNFVRTVRGFDLRH